MQRQVDLAGSRRLVVRPVQPDDIDGLTELFGSLSDDDRYLRFFSAYRPDLDFLEPLSRLDGERGLALVAVVDGDRIVAEADFHVQQRRPDPELSITVAPDWRGWLGPYLLDALLEAAAERGFPNLEAEVLLSNNKMLGLLRGRGYAVAEGPGSGTVRVVVSTSGAVPSWSDDHDRRRILIEVQGGHWRGAEMLRDAGFHVLACPGPPAGHEARCPALAGRPCPLVEGADAVIVALGDQADRLVAAHRTTQPEVPVCVAESREAVDAFLDTIGATP